MRRCDGDGRYVGGWHDGTWHGQVSGEYSAGTDDLAVGGGLLAEDEPQECCLAGT